MSHEVEVRFREDVLRQVERRGGDSEARAIVAEAAGVAVSELRRWARRVRAGKPVYAKRGPQPRSIAQQDRQKAIRTMLELGPFAGVPALRAECKNVPYRFLARMKERLLRVMKRRWRWYQRRLLWLRAGAVWAADFTQPKARLWDGNTKLFVVRDLGSGAQLAAVACKGERAQVACAVLLSLIVLLGAPLVLKKDNGSAFRSHELQARLKERGITPLDSPPYTPQYNGACERSGGNFKLRVEHVAASCGRAGEWLPQDLDEALFVANTRSRPFGATGPTPAEALDSRARITDEERRAFLAAVATGRESSLETFKAKNSRMATCSERAAIDRKATQDALCENGYLQFRKGRLSTLISTWRARRNS